MAKRELFVNIYECIETGVQHPSGVAYATREDAQKAERWINGSPGYWCVGRWRIVPK